MKRAIIFTSESVVTFVVADAGAPAPAQGGKAYRISPGEPGHLIEQWLAGGWRIESFNSAFTLVYDDSERQTLHEMFMEV